jgi:hypothetical protein
MARPATNALAVAIPCHRVVRSDGGLSGYRWGIERKRALAQAGSPGVNGIGCGIAVVAMNSQLVCSRFPLPAGFRPAILLAPCRDTQEVAESVSANGLRKGLLWNGFTGTLLSSFRPNEPAYRPSLVKFLRLPSHFEAMLRRMLGLSQDVATFEQQYADHPQLGGIARQAGLSCRWRPALRNDLGPSPASRSSVAVAVRRKRLVPQAFATPAACSATDGAAGCRTLSLETLRQAGFSTTGQTLLTTPAA